ncbi:type VII secretion system-associated protein [Microbacterium tumbae]
MTTPAAPPVTDELRAEAKANPGSWVYAIDSGFDGSSSVPPEGVIGAWHSDENGELSAEFTPNPRYAPTPQARGWAAPASPLERILQLLLSGYVSAEQFHREFAAADVIVFSRPEGGFFLAPAADGGQVVYAYTDPDKAAESGYAEHRAVPGAELAASLPDAVRIVLNPGSVVSIVIQPEDIANA